MNPSIFDHRALNAVMSAGSETAGRWLGSAFGASSEVDDDGPTSEDDEENGKLDEDFLYDAAEDRLRRFNMYSGDYVDKSGLRNSVVSI